MLVSLLAVSFLAVPAPATSASPAAVAFPVATAPVAAMSDAQILGFVDQVNRAEIEAGKLALTKTTSVAVRNFANMLVTDHEKAMAADKSFAAKQNITIAVDPDTSMAHSHDAEMVKLHGLSGKDFDQEFAKAMADGHKSVIDKFNSDLIPDATTAALKAHLRAILPTLEKHERAAVSIQKSKM
jgi:putative membrane protein